MFTISIDLARNLVEIAFAGFLQSAEVVEFHERLQADVAGSLLRPGPVYLLVDTTELQIQSQSVLAVFDLPTMSAHPGSRRVALFTGNSAQRSQARRVIGDRPFQMFETRAEALVWLFEGGSKPQGAAARRARRTAASPF